LFTYGFFLTSLLFAQAGCESTATKDDEVLSRVGSRSLTLSEAMSGLPASDLRQDSIRAIRDYIESWERRAILSVEAEKLGLTGSPEIRRQLDLARDQVLSDAMLKYLHAQLDTVKLTESDWVSFFESNPVMVKVSEPSLIVYHFYGSQRDSIFALRDEMSRRGQSEIVLKRLKDIDFAWWTEQQMPKTVQMLASEYPMLRSFWSSTTPKRISEVIQRNDLWHYFWVEGVVPVGTAIDTSLVRPYIEDWLLVQKKNRRLRALEQSIILNAQQTNLLQRQ
jgi:hypothetical protein